MFTQSKAGQNSGNNLPPLKKQKTTHSSATLFQQQKAIQDLQQGKPNVNPAHLPEISVADNQRIVISAVKETIIQAYLKHGLLATFSENSMNPSLDLAFKAQPVAEAKKGWFTWSRR